MQPISFKRRRLMPQHGADQEGATARSGDTNFETMAQREDYAGAKGHRAGAARSPKEDVTEGSGAADWVEGSRLTRRAWRTINSLENKREADRRIASKLGRSEANDAERASAKERTKHLIKERLPEVRDAVTESKTLVRTRWEKFEKLPRHIRGYFEHWLIVAGMEAGVVAFDGVALHGPLQHAGFSGVSLIAVTATVPILLAAVNHGLGALAGAIGLRVGGESKLKLAFAIFALALTGLVASLIMLTVFRAEATTGQNGTIRQWASGEFSAAPQFLISPTWLGPAQIAGSLAAIIAVAFWTAAQGGREVLRRVREAERQLRADQGVLVEVESEIEQAHELERQLAVSAGQIKVDAAEAQVEIDAQPEILLAELDAEDGAAFAAQGEMVNEYDYVEKIFRNGRIWRVALATVSWFGRRFTPSPEDAGAPGSDSLGSPNGYDALRPFKR